MTGSRYFIASADQPRVRRAADVTRMAFWLLVLLWAWSLYEGVGDQNQAIGDAISWIPGWLSGTLTVIYAVGALYAVGLLVALALQWRDRSDAIRDAVAAIVVAAVVTSLLTRWVTGDWPQLLPELRLAEPVAHFPLYRVAVITAVVRVLDPHLTRPMRRLGVGLIILTALAGIGLGLGLPASALGSIAVGIVAASVVLLVFGSPRGYPNPDSVAEALHGLGVKVSSLRLDDDQSWGVRRLVGQGEAAGKVEVKAYGRDATDSQLAARAWRYLWYRDTEPALALTRMQSVEHEALVTMMAARSGVPTTEVLAAGLGGDDVAILAVGRVGSGLDDLASDVEDARLAAIWRSVAEMHEAGISHGSLTPSAISISEDSHQFGDFGAGTLGAPLSFLELDVVELLFTLSELVGPERAVSTAREGLGDERLAAVLPYIQPPAVSARSRRTADKPKRVVEELRAEISGFVEVESEETVQIRRVSVRSLLMTGLTVFAAYFLITQLSGIDFEAVWAEIQGATWPWIIAAFVVGQSVYFPEATAMLAAVGHPIPLRPTVILQSAIKFISLAVPSSAGRIGMTAAFLRKYGVSFTASLVQGSIDTISGLIVEVIIILIAVLFGGLNFGISTGEPEWLAVIIIGAVLGMIVVTLVRRVERLRNWVMPIIGEAWNALGGVIKDPKRTLALLASNFGSRFLLAIAMWLILQSMGVSLGIFSVLAATVVTGLLGGVIPVPGGIGVSEAVLTASLVIFGVDETTAFAAAVVYRVATFYIPSGYGWFSMRWLEKNGYI